MANTFAESSSDVMIGGRSLATLRREARREMVALARRYTAEVGGDTSNSAPIGDGPLVVTGHQPVWFHPGVWAKNFAARAIADATGGTAINLIVDHDTRGATAVWVPRGTRRLPTREAVAYDRFEGPRPWEELAGVADPERFASFGDRLSESLRSWEISPLAASIWPGVVRRVRGGERIVDAFVSARVTMERSWGAGTLELPTSRMAQTDAFRWFAAHVLSRLPTLHALHNRMVRTYRRVNKIRNDRHPVPELGTRDGGWLEAPLWVWKTGATQRGRLFARREGQRLLLADEHGSLPELTLTDNGDLCCAARDLAAWPSQGLRLRPRALTMTMFARVFLADFFIHGIGGAKYDEITDRLVAEHYGLAPPEFLTFTSTEHLPLGEWQGAAAEADRAARKLREFEFNPERFLSAAALAEPEMITLIADKRGLCMEQWADDRRRNGSATSTIPGVGTSISARDRFRRLREINALLGERLAESRLDGERALEEALLQSRANRVLASREYAWLLFPEDHLRKAMTRVGDSFDSGAIG
jgi:hypothetical protein